VENGSAGLENYYSDNHTASLIEEWNPTQDLNQAMMCVEKFMAKGLFKLGFCAEKWSAEMWVEGQMVQSTVINKSPALAICQAILEALDGK